MPERNVHPGRQMKQEEITRKYTNRMQDAVQRLRISKRKAGRIAARPLPVYDGSCVAGRIPLPCTFCLITPQDTWIPTPPKQQP